MCPEREFCNPLFLEASVERLQTTTVTIYSAQTAYRLGPFQLRCRLGAGNTPEVLSDWMHHLLPSPTFMVRSLTIFRILRPETGVFMSFMAHASRVMKLPVNGTRDSPRAYLMSSLEW